MSKKDRTGKMKTSLKQHLRQGKTLKPPMARLPVSMSSWIDARLPELLWAELLLTTLGQERGLSCIRSVAMLGRDNGEQLQRADVTHSALARWPEALRNEAIARLCLERDQKQALASLLLFPSLPARESWVRYLDIEVPENEAWQTLAEAVARVLNHQSQPATDARWARVVFRLCTGQLHFPEGMRDHIEELLRYPVLGDQRKVRPSVRAMEIGFDTLPGQSVGQWSDEFWGHCLRSSSCEPAQSATAFASNVGVTVQRLNEVAAQARAHARGTLRTTALDPRHDAVFGGALFALQIVEELMRLGNSTSVLGRSGVRTLLEILVTLSFLSSKRSPELWREFRAFGAGQAKLALLKLEQDAGSIRYVDQDDLAALANEDYWQEFVDIKLGHWAGEDLRRLSDTAGVKDEYDKYYDWTSTYVHGHWGAVRDTVFATCRNPLHRLHRVPRASSRTLPDVLHDAVRLANRILDLVDREYSGLQARL